MYLAHHNLEAYCQFIIVIPVAALSRAWLPSQEQLHSCVCITIVWETTHPGLYTDATVILLQTPNRKNLYNGILSKLRGLMIARMAKPEEVIVVEDENGNIVRETMKDTDTLARYKTMHETLVYLSNLGHEDTEHQMLEQLRLQVRK